MVEQKAIKESIFKRFSLLTWLGAFLVFVIVPVFLIISGYNSMLESRHEKQIHKAFRLMDNQLEYLVRHKKDEKFFHLLLKRVFYDAASDEKPISSITKYIKRLKTDFSGGFKFIVWDSKGKIIRSITDETGFRYVLTNIYKMFQAVAEHCRNNYPGSPERLDIVKEKINLFRSYLGRFLLANHLKYPYLDGIKGQCVLADTESNYPLFWYQAEKKLTMLCFISGGLLKRNYGLKYAIASLNKNKLVKSGLIIDNKVRAKLSESDSHEVLIESGKFSNAALSHRITSENLISFKHLLPGVIGFCLVPRETLSAGYPGKIKKEFYVRFLIILALLGFVFYCYSLTRTEWRFSIRFKLAILFLYVNGLPLLIMTSIGYEYLQQQRTNLIQENHRENERLLLELDSGYRRYKNHLALKTKELLADFMEYASKQTPSQDDMKFLKNQLSPISPSEIHIFTNSGNVFYYFKDDGDAKPQTFMRFFSNAAMIFANQKINQRLETLINNAGTDLSVAGREVFTRDSPFLRILLNKLNKIEIFNFGTEEKLCYATLLGDKLKRDFHSFLILVWKEQQAQANYVVETVKNFNSKDKSRFLGTYFTFDGKTFCPGLKNSTEMQAALQKAVNLQSFYDDSLVINNNKFVATAISGKSAGYLSFIALYPLNRIEKKINFLKLQLVLFIFISLAVSTAVALSLSNQFLEPVAQLSQAVVQIGRRNFRYRTSIDSNDEFKDLGEVFNSSIEELEDLEIGRVVQERLLPGNRLHHNGIEIFARTVTMTRLGGDYYDFFEIDRDHAGIFMGDVAGHGIPAAIIMAMAKASVLLKAEERKNPARMLLNIHQMLYSLKTRKFKRMMTCQYMTLNNQNGLLRLANAGHCYPVVVSDRGSKAEFVELIGSPAGIMKKAKYENIEVQLKEGDTVILYSDGMIEAANLDKGMFGTDRFLRLAKESWSTELSEYYQRMFEVNQAWAASAEDDLTIVLIRVSGKNK